MYSSFLLLYFHNIFEVIVPFEVVVCTLRYKVLPIFLHVEIQSSQHCLLKMLCVFPQCVFSIFVKNHIAATAWTYTWCIDSLPLINVFVFVPFHPVVITLTHWYNMKSSMVILSAVLFLGRISLNNLCLHKLNEFE